MSTSAETYEAALERACTTCVAVAASNVDRDGVFPTKSIEALTAAGLLGALSSAESGGLSLGLQASRPQKVLRGVRLLIVCVIILNVARSNPGHVEPSTGWRLHSK
jgi:alkylation response protein AidB-like acyl-CoA dehydrogenase